MLSLEAEYNLFLCLFRYIALLNIAFNHFHFGSFWFSGVFVLSGMFFFQFFPELWPFANLGILNLSARYLENY